MLNFYIIILVVFIGAAIPIVYLLQKVANLEEKVMEYHIEAMMTDFKHEITITNHNYLKAMILTNMCNEDKQLAIDHLKREIAELTASESNKIKVDKRGNTEHDRLVDATESIMDKIGRKMQYRIKVNYNEIITYLQNTDKIDYKVIANKLIKADTID